jgi:hypothetical protein
VLWRLFKLFLVASLWGKTSMAVALPDLCLQSPKRISACPHLLYKKSKLAIPKLAVQANDIVCLCLTDLNPLLKRSNSEIEKIDQQLAWLSLTQEYGLTKEEIMALIRE